MAITEVAVLRVHDPKIFTDDAFLKKLSQAKAGMEYFTGRHFDYLLQIKDPKTFYILGEWASLTQHMDEWLPSVENQELLKLLKDDVEVVSLSHLDVDKTSLPEEAERIAIERYVVKSIRKDEFTQAFEVFRSEAAASGSQPSIAGWVLGSDDQAGKAEFMTLSARNRIGEQRVFADSSQIKRCWGDGILHESGGVYINHVRKLKLP